MESVVFASLVYLSYHESGSAKLHVTQHPSECIESDPGGLHRCQYDDGMKASNDAALWV